MSTLTPVLMLVPYFAPQSHAAMFRAHKLAKYLPEFGYKPIVVTTDTNYMYNEDINLLAELPTEVEIHRARYIEPTIRGIRMAMGGQDRRFVTLKNDGKIDLESYQTTTSIKHVRKRLSIGGIVSKTISNWPDRHWTWTGPAIRLSERLIKQHNIQLLYTSANPISFLRAAIRIKKMRQISWLFDSRDPLGYGEKHSAQNLIVSKLENSIIRSAIANADHVTGSSSSYGQIFFDLYGLDECKWSFIPTGLDDAYVSYNMPAKRVRNLLHIGEVMSNQSPYIFQVLDTILQKTGSTAPFDKLVFIGRREVNEPIIRRLTGHLKHLSERIEFLDHRPQSEVYSLMRQSRACLLVPGSTRYWWNNFAKMVDYIGLSVPVIAHVPTISEARIELEKAGTAIFLNTDNSEDANSLLNWLKNEPSTPKSGYSERYTARRQVADFATLFDQLLSRKQI